jgi:very-short-patch-repair endonuclease
MSLLKLKTILPQCGPEQVYTAERKKEILNAIEELNTHDNETIIEEYKEITELMAKRIQKPQKELIHEKITNIIEIIETKETIKITKITQIITDNKNNTINKNNNIEKIENELDNKIEHYTKFTKTNPMIGITWDKTRKKYRLYYDKINKYDSDLTKLTKEIIELIITKIKNTTKNNKISYIIPILNKIYDNKIISYIYNNIELFDILHVFYFLKLKDPRKKYNIYKNKIEYCYLKKNIYNGYIIKKLIDYNTFIEIIHSSNKIAVVDASNIFGLNIMSNINITKEQKYIYQIKKVFEDEKMIEQYYYKGYKIDLYFNEYNIAIECDEFDHTNRNINNEKKRESLLIKKLNCIFIRFNPDEINFDINNVLSQIYKNIKKCIVSK